MFQLMLRKAARELVTKLHKSASAGSTLRQTGSVQHSKVWQCSPAPVCTCRSYATASHLATHAGQPQVLCLDLGVFLASCSEDERLEPGEKDGTALAAAASAGICGASGPLAGQ